MRNLDRDRPAVAHICPAENGCHAASGDQAIDAVMIELIARMEFAHWEGRSAASTTPAANLYQYSLYGRRRYMPIRSTPRIRINCTLILSPPPRSLARATSFSAARWRSWP